MITCRVLKGILKEVDSLKAINGILFKNFLVKEEKDGLEPRSLLVSSSNTHIEFVRQSFSRMSGYYNIVSLTREVSFFGGILESGDG